MRIAKIKTVIILLMLVPSVMVNGAKEARDTLTASEIFAELPISVLDMLSKSTRLDMLDFYSVDSIYQARNTMGGLSHLEQVTEDYLKVSLTSVSNLVIKVLPTKSADIFVAAYTVGDASQACDTDIRFYDSSFKELSVDKYLEKADLEDFFKFPDNESRQKCMEAIPFSTIRYKLYPGDNSLMAELTINQVVNEDAIRLLEPYMRKELRYSWTGSRYKLLK